MTNCFPLRDKRAPGAIFLTVLGFILYWPLGLAMVAYMIWGDRLHEGFDALRRRFDGGSARGGFEPGFGRTGNVAFDDYRARELKRLEEERRRLDTMREEFDTFLRELRRAKDQEEFDRFMRNRGAFGGDGPTAA